MNSLFKLINNPRWIINEWFSGYSNLFTLSEAVDYRWTIILLFFNDLVYFTLKETVDYRRILVLNSLIIQDELLSGYSNQFTLSGVDYRWTIILLRLNDLAYFTLKETVDYRWILFLNSLMPRWIINECPVIQTNSPLVRVWISINDHFVTFERSGIFYP